MDQTKTKIISSKISTIDYWKEVFDYKELFWILAQRDIKVRYKQTIFGILWSVVRPLVSAFVYIFGVNRLTNLNDNSEIPYIFMLLPGTILWLFYSQSFQNISQSLVINSNLVSKVFFPRIIIPFSSFFLGLLDFCIGFVVFLGFCLYYQIFPNWNIIFIPFLLIISYLSATGIGLFAAVLNVKYRDIGQIVPFIINFGFFISPVLYTTDTVKSHWGYSLFVLNPVTGSIDALRWAMLGGHADFNFDSFIPLCVFCLISLTLSVRYFRKHENVFVDYL